MTSFYKGKRSRNLYNPKDVSPFRVSRSKLELFLNCPRCFYIDRRLGVSHPPGYPFNLNNAVDTLLKKEFDLYRETQQPHPLFKEFGIDAVPFKHPKINDWRNSLQLGITHAMPGTNLLITGGIDDVWHKIISNELYIADYKATSKIGSVSLDAEWQKGYKRQAEIYQWLFRKNNFKVSDTAYFVYCNGKTDNARFDSKLDFDIKIIAYEGDASWVDAAVQSAYECLRSDTLPEYSEDCDYCTYIQATHEVVRPENK